MSGLLRSLRQRAAARREDERGIIALMTLIFMMNCGFFVLLMIWAIGYQSAASTNLYGATQAAAYAAASEVELGNATQSGYQLTFDCGNFDSTLAGSSTRCTGGRTAEAARASMAAHLAPGAKGKARFGLTYPNGTVELVDENGSAFDGVLAFEIPYPSGAAYLVDDNCSGSATPDGAVTAIRTCWRNPTTDFGVADPNYVSGVVVIARASIPLFPGCPRSIFGDFCARTISASVPARSAQVLRVDP